MIRLSIQSQPALIGIQTTLAKLEMRSQLPVVQIEQQQAQVIQNTTKPKILIDQSACFSEEGHKTNKELIEENAQLSISAMYQSIGRIVDQGNQMADIRRGMPNVIANQGYDNAYTQFEHEYNYGTIPINRPQIDYIPGTVDIQVQGGTARLTPQKGTVEYQYAPGKVEIYMKQMNSISIQVEGSMLDMKG